ncbi:MAG: glucose-1-phosphate adenylyltransferase [Myxococcales bacterium]|nr:glucose-1-phosphate adenylyltransferase [Myxococcales bacterium]
MPRVYTVILGGGRGSRLFPLTAHRAKPAVPVAGKYRLIDIPLSNAINSGYRHIAVLTQFNSASLNAHVSNTYHFDMFSQGLIEVLAAEQTDESMDWYQGTADAVRKQLRRLAAWGCEHLLILSGDHLYRMDYREIVKRHVDSGADATVSVIPVPRRDCTGFGVLSADTKGFITNFKEKPKADEDISDLAPPEELRALWGLPKDEYLASMGVYVFRFDVLQALLQDPTLLDFGNDILPMMLGNHKLGAHLFKGYWRDIGTISSFFEANLALTMEDPEFRIFHETGPIYARQRFLPASKFLDARVRQSIVSDGCLIQGASVEGSVIGIRSRIQRGAELKDVIMMGADYYENDAVRAANKSRGIEAAGVGPGAIVERAILDKNARIGEGAIIRGAPDRPDEDGDGWYLRDGIVIVPKDATVKPGTVV